MDKEKFAERLRFLMANKLQKNGKPTTSYTIGKESEVSSSTIDNLLNCKSTVCVDNAVIIAKYFNCSLDYLLTGEDFHPEVLDTTPVEVPRHLYDLLVADSQRVGMLRNYLDQIVSIMKMERNIDENETKNPTACA